MSKTPPIPPQQRSFHGPRANPALREDEEHAHGTETTPRDRSRFGGARDANVRPQARRVQDR